MQGFFNRMLLVDLSASTSQVRELDDGLLSATLGGKGLATRLLMELNPPKADPLGPDNHLIIATGPVTGSPIQGSCRYGIYAKSPLTGFYGESYSGGRVPEAVSRTGFDAIVLAGQSAEPVVLVIDENGAAIHPAGDLWGMDTYQAEEQALERYGTEAKGANRSGAMVIGVAGENLVRFSVIENDKWRSAGRTGMGAVLGSKKVKGLVFNGSSQRQWAHPQALAEYVKEFSKAAKDNPGAAAYRSMGTPMMVDVLSEANAFPSRYWSQGKVKHQSSINAQAMNETLDVRPHACLRCFMACGKLSTVKEGGKYPGLTVEGPEYETIYAFGGLCEIDSIEEILRLNDICDRLGMDTITGGNLCAFVMEATQRGKSPEPLQYGDAQGTAELLEKIALRQGIGEILSQGIVPASREWGLEDIAVHVKGMEPAGYDPRVLKGTGLGYAVSCRGACHLRATFYKPELAGMSPPDQMDDKAEIFLDFEDRLTLFDCLILCRFYRDFYPWEEMAKLIKLTCGLELDQAGLQSLVIGVSNQVRRFNLREGLTPDDDTLPKRMYQEPLDNGQSISEEELIRLRQDYYRLRGWDENGVPPQVQ